LSQHRELGIDQQLQLAREIARLTRARLPLQQALVEIAGKQAWKRKGSLAHAAQLLGERLAQGQSLTDSLAPGQKASTRMLASVIEIGQAANQLPAALESWTRYHIDYRHSRQRLQTALVYPALLIVVTVVSLVFTAWKLIPHYDQAFTSLAERRPDWLAAVQSVHANLGLFSIVFVAVVCLPPTVWWLRRRSLDRYGVPRDPSGRYYLHAHAARLARSAVATGRSVKDFLDCLLQGCGQRLTSPKKTGTDSGAHHHIQNDIQSQASFALLGRETALTLASLDARIISPQQCHELLTLIAEQTDRRAEAQAESDARWLPMLVALTVGVGIAIAYVGLIYLPWVTLFYEIASPIEL
jgi:hypothetical protein